MTTAMLVIIFGCASISIVMLFGWALCAAAKRGDEMTDECEAILKARK